MSYDDPDQEKNRLERIVHRIEQYMAQNKARDSKVGERIKGNPLGEVSTSTSGLNFLGEAAPLDVYGASGYAGMAQILGIVQRNQTARKARGESTEVSDFTDKHFDSVHVADGSKWTMAEARTTSQRTVYPDWFQEQLLDVDKAEEAEESEQDKQDEEEYLEVEKKKRKRKIFSFQKKHEE